MKQIMTFFAMLILMVGVANATDDGFIPQKAGSFKVIPKNAYVRFLKYQEKPDVPTNDYDVKCSSGAAVEVLGIMFTLMNDAAGGNPFGNDPMTPEKTITIYNDLVYSGPADKEIAKNFMIEATEDGCGISPDLNERYAHPGEQYGWMDWMLKDGTVKSVKINSFYCGNLFSQDFSFLAGAKPVLKKQNPDVVNGGNGKDSTTTTTFVPGNGQPITINVTNQIIDSGNSSNTNGGGVAGTAGAGDGGYYVYGAPGPQGQGNGNYGNQSGYYVYNQGQSQPQQQGGYVQVVNTETPLDKGVKVATIFKLFASGAKDVSDIVTSNRAVNHFGRWVNGTLHPAGCTCSSCGGGNQSPCNGKICPDGTAPMGPNCICNYSDFAERNQQNNYRTTQTNYPSNQVNRNQQVLNSTGSGYKKSGAFIR